MEAALQPVIERLNKEKEKRGQLTRIATGSGVSYRTIYSVMTGANPSLSTLEKLSAYFTKVDKKIAKGDI